CNMIFCCDHEYLNAQCEVCTLCTAQCIPMCKRSFEDNLLTQPTYYLLNDAACRRCKLDTLFPVDIMFLLCISYLDIFERYWKINFNIFNNFLIYISVVYPVISCIYFIKSKFIWFFNTTKNENFDKMYLQIMLDIPRNMFNLTRIISNSKCDLSQCEDVDSVTNDSVNVSNFSVIDKRKETKKSVKSSMSKKSSKDVLNENLNISNSPTKKMATINPSNVSLVDMSENSINTNSEYDDCALFESKTSLNDSSDSLIWDENLYNNDCSINVSSITDVNVAKKIIKDLHRSLTRRVLSEKRLLAEISRLQNSLKEQKNEHERCLKVPCIYPFNTHIDCKNKIDHLNNVTENLENQLIECKYEYDENIKNKNNTNTNWEKRFDALKGKNMKIYKKNINLKNTLRQTVRSKNQILFAYGDACRFIANQKEKIMLLSNGLYNHSQHYQINRYQLQQNNFPIRSPNLWQNSLQVTNSTPVNGTTANFNKHYDQSTSNTSVPNVDVFVPPPNIHLMVGSTLMSQPVTNTDNQKFSLNFTSPEYILFNCDKPISNSVKLNETFPIHRNNDVSNLNSTFDNISLSTSFIENQQLVKSQFQDFFDNKNIPTN
ncbi:hypothetical protein A3Q56_06183, partial [Intoshia linei]